jgi:hypothetical protein
MATKDHIIDKEWVSASQTIAQRLYKRKNLKMGTTAHTAVKAATFAVELKASHTGVNSMNDAVPPCVKIARSWTR